MVNGFFKRKTFVSFRKPEVTSLNIAYDSDDFFS